MLRRLMKVGVMCEAKKVWTDGQMTVPPTKGWTDGPEMLCMYGWMNRPEKWQIYRQTD